jgi:cell division cycle protein 37
MKTISFFIFQKFGAMDQVAHQCIAMQYLLELSKQLDIDPRACISQFFTK